MAQPTTRLRTRRERSEPWYQASDGRRAPAAIVVVTCLLVSTGCGEGAVTPDPDPDPEPTVASLVVTSPIGTRLPTDWQAMLGVTAVDGEGQPMTVTPVWTSDDPSVATVGGAGLMTTLGPGGATVTATVGTVAGNLTFTIVDVDVEAVTTLLHDPFMEELALLLGDPVAGAFVTAVGDCRAAVGAGDLQAGVNCVAEAHARLDDASDPIVAVERALLALFLDHADLLTRQP